MARGIKERTGVCSVTVRHPPIKQPGFCSAREATGCYQVMDGLGRQRRQRFTGTVPVWPLQKYCCVPKELYCTIEATAKQPGTAKLRALGRTDPDPCYSIPCRENYWVKEDDNEASRRQLCSAQCKGWSDLILAIELCWTFSCDASYRVSSWPVLIGLVRHNAGFESLLQSSFFMSQNSHFIDMA